MAPKKTWAIPMEGASDKFLVIWSLPEHKTIQMWAALGIALLRLMVDG